MATLYLLHFPEPYCHARHYAGYTKRETLQPRMEEHLRGEGSALVLAVAKRLGITDPEDLMTRLLAAVWAGTRTEERRIKNYKGLDQICPICRAGRGLGPWHGVTHFHPTERGN